MSYAVSRCLHVLAEIGVADALGDSPRTATDLAASTGANAGALARALRLVSAYGVFEQCNDGFAHIPASRLLRTDHPQSMRSFVRWTGAPIDWQSFELLKHSVRTGSPAAELVTPGGAWAYLEQHPEISHIFDEAMTGKAHGQIAGILSTYDFSTFKTVADIGGGRGHLLQAVLDAAPNATGVLFDQPHVVKDLAGTASARFTLQGGDFFKDALPVCDAYNDHAGHTRLERPASRRDPERHSTGCSCPCQALTHRGDYSRRLEPQLDQARHLHAGDADGQGADAPRVRGSACGVWFPARQGDRRRTGYIDPRRVGDLVVSKYSIPLNRLG
jgi:hypothetical protein